MAAVFNWCEDNGAATGSPAHGTTQTGFGGTGPFPNDVNWKNADDCTNNGGTAFTASPVGPPPANSFVKNQYGYFASGFNQISAGLFAHTATAFGSNITLMGIVQSTYRTPVTTVDANLSVNMTSAIAISSGQAVLFSTSGPYGAGPAATLSVAGYTQYLSTQLQIASGVAPGNTAQVTLTLQYNED